MPLSVPRTTSFRALTALAAGATLAAGGCAGAGAAGAHRAAGRSSTSATTMTTATAAMAPVSKPVSSCSTDAAATLRGVVRRIYAQAASGRNVVAAERRLARSAALSRAVAQGDAAATRVALKPLLRNQIHRIIIWRGTHQLASYGRSPALAPVQGTINDANGRPVGHYTLSVAQDAAIAGIIRSTTGAAVTIAHGGAPVSGATFTMSARAFPHGSLTIAVRAPAGACGATHSATKTATELAIARRLFTAESSGSGVRRVLRHVAHDAQFRRAVATDNAAMLRAAIVRFFRTPWMHVVRIRATDVHGHLVNDVGGPYVLAPASAPVLDAHGRRIGRVTLSIQDDAGYIKLLHRFTGGAVQLRTAAGLVPGSALHMPPGAAVRTGFTARAFPSGPLRVSLVVP